jgi:hypothetical protein
MNYYAPTIILTGPFPKQKDFMFYAAVPDLSSLADTAEFLARSPVAFCEGDYLLGRS